MPTRNPTTTSSLAAHRFVGRRAWSSAHSDIGLDTASNSAIMLRDDSFLLTGAGFDDSCDHVWLWPRAR
jgi:hypothetical protein